MKVSKINEIKIGSALAQSIFRHDGLLALPKGVLARGFVKNTLQSIGLDYVLIMDENESLLRKNDIQLTLEIIQFAFTKTTLWTQEFGEAMYEKLEQRILKNQRIQEYLNELRFVDSFSFAQCVNNSILVTLMLGSEEEISDDLVEVALLILVHDIGKIYKKDLLLKERSLSSTEYEALKEHVEISYKLLKKAGYEDEQLRFVMEHHERWDGTGYPLQLSGKKISHLAQLLSVADLYNALASYRPYRDAFLPYEIEKMIEDERSRGFSEEVVDYFMERFTPYRVGSEVQLNNGEVAIVKKVWPKKKTLPVVSVMDEDGDREVMIDLSLKTELRISRVLRAY